MNIYILAYFLNWQHKHNILGNMILLGNHCINLCLKKVYPNLNSNSLQGCMLKTPRMLLS